MQRLRCILFGVVLGLTALSTAPPIFGQQSGTLVLQVMNYTSDTKIPKNNQKALQHGGIQWGMFQNTVLISFVAQNFLKAEIPYITRFGEQKTLQLAPGRYTITCIGYQFNSTSSDPDKTLAKSAFFNNDVVAFDVLPGKTTTLEIYPNYVAESQWRLLTKFKLFIPELKVRVIEDGTQKGDNFVINQRTDKSVEWDDYHGPLKF